MVASVTFDTNSLYRGADTSDLDKHNVITKSSSMRDIRLIRHS